MSAPEEKVALCAICHQDDHAPCRGRLTGRKLTHWHFYPEQKRLIHVTLDRRKKFQTEFKKRLGAGGGS